GRARRPDPDAPRARALPDQPPPEMATGDAAPVRPRAPPGRAVRLSFVRRPVLRARRRSPLLWHLELCPAQRRPCPGSPLRAATDLRPRDHRRGARNAECSDEDAPVGRAARAELNCPPPPQRDSGQPGLD